MTASCSGSDEGTQPAPDVSTFEQGDFGDIPLHPTSSPLGSRSEKNGTVARSYTVRNTTARQVLEFYESALDEHEVIEAPQDIGRRSWRGLWRVDGRELTVSATAISQPGDVEERPARPSEYNVQYSLSLGPRDG